MDIAEKFADESDTAPTVAPEVAQGMPEVAQGLPEVVPLEVKPVSPDVGQDQRAVVAEVVAAVIAKAGSLAVVETSEPPLKANKLVVDRTTGLPHIVVRSNPNVFTVLVSSKYAEALIREAARKKNKRLNRTGVNDVKYQLQSEAELLNIIVDIWFRVAPVPGGVKFDIGDSEHTRVRVTAGKVEIVTSGSQTLFSRSPGMLPMAMPADIGDIRLLKKYVNLHPVGYVLWLAWVTYTMATPKKASSKFPIMDLHGGEGSGKSALAKRTQCLIDPNRVGLQRLPKTEKDFAVAAQSAHVLAFDNLRFISHETADTLCMASTGGNVVSRALYTDGDQSILSLHVAVILNGIPNVVDQPDLAQRTLQLHVLPLSENARRSEADMEAELALDLPAIQRGLFDLIAKIFEQLPHVKLTRPSRMLDFSRWLAAMELVDGAPQGAYQEEYLHTLNQAQLDSVLDNPLAAEVLAFAERLPAGEVWSGTPSSLLNALNRFVDTGTASSLGWPTNVIALSKRLLPLQTALRSQGVLVELSRGKERTITLKWVEGFARATSFGAAVGDDLDL